MKKTKLFIKNTLLFIIEPFKFLYIKDSPQKSSFLIKNSWILYIGAVLIAGMYIYFQWFHKYVMNL